MHDLTLIPFGNQSIRITGVDGEPWFVLNDVLDAIHTKSTRAQVIASINQGLGDGVVKNVPIRDALGREQPTIIVAEPAVTYTISRSNTEQARRLNRLLHGEILPEIRKTGGYGGESLKARIACLTDALFEARPRWKKIAGGTLAGFTEAEMASALGCGVKTIQTEKQRMRALGLLGKPSDPGVRNDAQLDLFGEVGHA